MRIWKAGHTGDDTKLKMEQQSSSNTHRFAVPGRCLRSAPGPLRRHQQRPLAWGHISISAWTPESMASYVNQGSSGDWDTSLRQGSNELSRRNARKLVLSVTSLFLQVLANTEEAPKIQMHTRDILISYGKRIAHYVMLRLYLSALRYYFLCSVKIKSVIGPFPREPWKSWGCMDFESHLEVLLRHFGCRVTFWPRFSSGLAWVFKPNCFRVSRRLCSIAVAHRVKFKHIDVTAEETERHCCLLEPHGKCSLLIREIIFGFQPLEERVEEVKEMEKP